MLARDLALEFQDLVEDLLHGLLGQGQHARVVGVDGQVDVAVAVAGVHVVGDDDARVLHVLEDLAQFLVQLGVLALEVLEEEGRLQLQLLLGQLVLAGLALDDGRGHVHLHAHELVVDLDSRQRLHLAQGLAVGDGQVIEVLLLQEVREVRDDLQGDDDVLVELESAGALGDGRELVPVVPEDLGLAFVGGHEAVDVVVVRADVRDAAHGVEHGLLVGGVELDDEHRDGDAVELLGLLGILDGLDVLDAELLQGRELDQVAPGADLVAQGHDVLDDVHGVAHGIAVEFQTHDARVGQDGVQGEGGLGDDAVHAFLLHAGQAAQKLVGHVLAQGRAADLVALEGQELLAVPEFVEDLVGGGLVGHDLVPGVVHPPDLDQFARGQDHPVGQEVVQGRAVLEGEGAAGVLRDVAADGRGGLGGRVHGEEQALGRGCLDGVQGDDAGLQGDGPALDVDVHDVLQAAQAQDHAARLGRHGAARESRSAAAGHDGEAHLVGQPDDALDLGRVLGEDHQGRQLHAQVRGVGGALDEVVGRGDDLLLVQDFGQALHECRPELLVGFPVLPEALQAARELAEVFRRQGGALGLQPGVHALADVLGRDERVVADDEQLFCQVQGQLLQVFGPGLELFERQSEDAFDQAFGGEGYMWSFLGHGDFRWSGLREGRW